MSTKFRVGDRVLSRHRAASQQIVGEIIDIGRRVFGPERNISVSWDGDCARVSQGWRADELVHEDEFAAIVRDIRSEHACE